MQRLVVVILALGLAGCATTQRDYIASRKSAVELRTMQTRVVPVDADTAVRDVIETMQDLGYRITRVTPDAGTISGTRAATLRLAVVVQPRGETESAVRANASVISARAEAQVDSPVFYQRNFFEPLGAILGRTPAPIGDTEATPDAARPVAEINTAAEREARARSNAATTE